MSPDASRGRKRGIRPRTATFPRRPMDERRRKKKRRDRDGTQSAQSGPSIHETVDAFFRARVAIFAHVSYVEDWRILPLFDSRDQFWSVDDGEVKFSADRGALTYWLAGHDDEYGPHADRLFFNKIYTQRHLPRWVYRGAALTMIVVDTETDVGQLLQLFRNDHEVTS